MYMGCAKRNEKPDAECKSDFNVCSMVAMGMPPNATTTTTTTTRRPISDIDLAVPEFLRPQPTTKRPLRPIQDIDLPQEQASPQQIFYTDKHIPSVICPETWCTYIPGESYISL